MATISQQLPAPGIEHIMHYQYLELKKPLLLMLQILLSRLQE